MKEERLSSRQHATQITLRISSKQEHWEIGRHPIPRPGKGEALVKIRATGLNHFDWMAQKFGFFVDHFPAVVGVDAAGDVAEIGEGVTNVVVGDRVCHPGSFMTNDYATYQFYTLVPAKFISKIPNAMSYDQAATIPFCLSAASFGLYSPLHQGGLGLTPPWRPEGWGKYKHHSIVILGGASSVGKYAIQLARASGFSPIITTASLCHEASLRSLGATHVFDRSTSDIAEKIELVFVRYGKVRTGSPSPTMPSPKRMKLAAAKTFPGLADVVFDALSLPETRQLALQLANPRTGSVVFSLPPPEEIVAQASRENRKVVTPCALSEKQPEIAEGLFGALSGWLKSGVIRPNKHRVIPGGITAIPHGLQLLEARKFGGCKLVINP